MTSPFSTGWCNPHSTQQGLVHCVPLSPDNSHLGPAPNELESDYSVRCSLKHKSPQIYSLRGPCRGGILHHGTIDILSGVIPCRGGCPVHCKKVSWVLCLYLRRWQIAHPYLILLQGPNMFPETAKYPWGSGGW